MGSHGEKTTLVAKTHYQKKGQRGRTTTKTLSRQVTKFVINTNF
ncbi:hypothetical protein HMPREF9136_1695 [Prevotella dentalis DSM 3688]|uniref:Uncharacterized protein n=1 Tax=Prevotella dentalis (strain ATCC 49559 / DSM 3688 / JCM 13448 / NCTC 12043 / ES 2772) TaxID=908937 RepID=F9D4B7_PREDD|nr:hypothetical protein HMPREF9136_1695 [Prevotella dentalis DSM 3688]